MNFLEPDEQYDVRLKCPSSSIIAGSSGCGKTSLILKILENIDVMIEKPSVKENVIYFYNNWQPLFESFRKKGIVKEWINEAPTEESMIAKTLGHNKSGSIVIIDDFGAEIGKDFVKIFAELCHHTQSMVFLLNQTIFPKNPYFRDISLNAGYCFLFKNPRDKSQITNFARQFSPGNTRYVVDAFHEATREPHSYLLFDLLQGTPDSLRLRSNLLPTSHNPFVEIWREKKKKKK